MICSRSLDALSRGGLLKGTEGVPDHVEHEFRVGEHRDMAAVQLGCGGAHALRDRPLQLGMDRAIFRGHGPQSVDEHDTWLGLHRIPPYSALFVATPVIGPLLGSSIRG